MGRGGSLINSIARRCKICKVRIAAYGKSECLVCKEKQLTKQS